VVSEEEDDPPAVISLRLSARHQQQLERMRVEGGYRSRAQLLQSLIAEILRDDAKAHGEETGENER